MCAVPIHASSHRWAVQLAQEPPQLLDDEASKKMDPAKAIGVLNAIGTHCITSLDYGNAAYQVFPLTNSQFQNLDVFLPHLGLAAAKVIEDYNTIENISTLSRIFSGNRSKCVLHSYLV